MKFTAFILGISVLTSIAIAETRNLNDIIQQADPNEKKDLMKILSDISLQPTTDPETGKAVFRVTKVASGSIYEKAGVKVGDFVVRDNSGGSKTMELKNNLKASIEDKTGK